MMRQVVRAFVLLSLVLARAAGAESFPKSDVFTALVADPIEPRNFVSFLHLDANATDTTLASVGLGSNFGLYRWPGGQPGDGWQVGIFAAFNSQFDISESSDPLINADYRVGFPLTFRRGAFSARARLFHQSSHLGDELILQGLAPARENLSVEVVDLVIAWERAGWRPYVGGLYLLRRDPDDLKKGGIQAGVDYVGSKRAFFGGKLVGGIDYRALEENDWEHGLSVKVGLEYGRPRPERRGVTVLLEYYDGSAPFGQFYRDDVTYYGVALQFDY